MVSPRTFGFFGFFGISAVLSIFFLDCFFVFWIFWNFCSFERFFFQNLTTTRVLFGMRSFLFVFGLRGGGGGFSQDFWIFWIFWNFRSSEHFFFGLFFCFLDFLEFLQFRAYFFQSLTRTRVFFWNEVIFVCFWPSRRGGGFSQDFWIFWIFWNFRSSEHFFFGLFFCFLDFLEFLQFRAFFFQSLTRTRVFFLE